MKKFLFVLFALLLVGNAFAEEKLISEPVHETTTVRAGDLPDILPEPSFEIMIEDTYVWVHAFVVPGIDEGIQLILDGVQVDNPCYLDRESDDYEVTFVARCVIDGYPPTDWKTFQLVVPALEYPPMECAMKPDINCSFDEGYVTVTIHNNEPDGIVYYRYKYVDDTSKLRSSTGEWSEWIEYIEPIVMAEPGAYYFESYASAPDRLPSETASLFFEIMPPEPLEMTDAPIVTIDLHNESFDSPCAIVYITPVDEDSEIYWRYSAGEYGEWSEWMVYTDPVCFTEVGQYTIHAFAIAPGKTESYTTECVFVLALPTPVVNYDFEEDGIYYNIIGTGKVGVTAYGEAPYSYEGDIVIPATVTHDGVTYMVTSVEQYAFYDCYDLTSVAIGNYVTAIGDRAFMNCDGLTSVTLGDYVITVGTEAFSGCAELTSVTIGSGVRSIGSKAFDGCPALATVICKPAVPPTMAGSDCFDCYNRASLHVFPAVLDSYQATNYWNMFTNIVGEDKVAPEPGDANGDGVFNISDIIQLINRLTAAP